MAEGEAIQPTEPKQEVAPAKDWGKEIEELNKTWQSRLDKLIAEKKETVSQKQTVEDRIAQIENERRAERLEYARKEARMLAKIDDPLDAAIREYASDDTERVRAGANKINELWAAREKTLVDRVKELELKLNIGSPAPKAGADPNQKAAMLQQYNALLSAGRGVEAQALFLKMRSMEATNG